jgi:hypothetical protein
MMKADLKQPAWPGSSHTLEEFKWGITDIQGRDYITVDCRLAMARVEHREAGKKLEIVISEIRPDIDRKGNLPMLVVQVVLESEIYGRAVGTATADISAGARAVDATNPVENAETSAVGRALGFYGYGTLQGQSGIASAEEVTDAKRRPIEAQKPAEKPQSASAEDGAVSWRKMASKYGGTCAVCGGAISEGDEIYYTSDLPKKQNVKHETCPGDSDVFPGGADYGEDDDPLLGPD